MRLSAFLLDLSLGHLLFYCNPDFFYRFFPLFLEGGLLPAIEMLSMLLIPTFLIRFYGTLLLGVSPGQWLCFLGVRPQGWRARLLGAIRVCSEIVGIPLFFIFQFPLLRGGKTWGESISGTRLTLKSRMSLPVQLLLIAVFVLFSLVIPLGQYFIFSEELKVAFTRKNLHALNSTQDVPVNIYSSNRFRFQTRSRLDEKRFLILPDFEFVKINNKKKIKPFLIVYDRRTKKTGHLKISGQVDFLSILEKGKRGNPLFRYYYPKISQAIDKDRNHYARVPYSERYESKPLIDIETQKEIGVFLGDVLNTSFSKIGTHLITKGPFVRGYWESKRDLLDLVEKGVRPEVSLLFWGNQGFLHFRQMYSMLEWSLRDTYIPTGTVNGIRLNLIWEDGAQDIEKTFLKDFFHSTKWYFDFKDTFSFPMDEDRLTPFHVIDYFLEQNLDEAKRELLENYLLKFYFLISKEVVNNNDSTLESLLVDIFVRYNFVAQTDYIGVRKNFISRLNAIKKALKLHQDDFFNKGGP